MQTTKESKTTIKTPIPLAAVAPSQLDATADFSTADCAVVLYGDKLGGEVTIKLDPEVLKRIRSRAGDRNLADYLYDMVLHRAVLNHVY